jgi:multidrug resistance protein, MATE family
LQQSLQVNTSYKQILSIALPIAASILVPQINFITNNVFLSHLNAEALALAGITGVYYLVFAVCGNGLNAGLQALISRRAGENNTSGIGQLFQQGVWIAMALSIVGILLTYLLAPTILGFSLHDEQRVADAVAFLKIRIWGLPFLYVYQMRNALLVGTNNSRFLVIGTLAETLANVVLDYGFIFGKLGLPNLGLMGAAYASVLAEITGLVVIFAVMRWQGLYQKFQLFGLQKFDWTAAKQILDQSAPLILQYAISVGSWEFFYILIEHHGTESLAVSNVMRNVFGLCGCLSWAFAATSTSMVSNVIGQGREDWVIPLIKKLMGLSVAYSATIAILLNIFPTQFLSIYGQGEHFTQLAIPVLRIVSSALVLMSISTVWLNALVGTGNSRLNLRIEIVAIVLYIVYTYTVLEKWNMPITWGWASEMLYWTSMFIPSYWYMMSGRWKGKKI